MGQWREESFGKRPARIANCSGFHGDPAEEMYNQAVGGDVDFICGDYLAEINIAKNAEAYRAGEHSGYEETAWEGLRMTIGVLDEKRIKVAINGGALNPKGLAQRVAELVKEKKYDLKVAYLSGDDLMHQVGSKMPSSGENMFPHLDSVNTNVQYCPTEYSFDKDTPILSANAYIGARGIVEGFRQGADIIICGRVSDASPVIAAAWYWWSWTETDYDCLAGGLIAGHLIECSAYVTGSNFAGFDKYAEEVFLKPGFPIAEVDRDGSCVITKHPNTGGVVNIDTVRCQLLYELQGNIYLHSDCKAVLDDVRVEQAGEDRVHVHGIKGLPPPSTTKLAIFYPGGYESQILFNATGYATSQKYALFERQVRSMLSKDVHDKMELFEFQRIGTPATDPKTQDSSTTYIRIYAQSRSADALASIGKAVKDISLRHFSGYHCYSDMRTAIPRPYIAYFPTTATQASIDEQIHLLNNDTGATTSSFPAGHPPKYENLTSRASHETAHPRTYPGPSVRMRLGDVALARSGDKGSNLNCGVFVQTPKQWDWLRSTLTRAKVKALMGEDWLEWYFMERVEFPGIYAVHFVVYGILGRGTTSTARLDGFGKGFADYLRDKVVDVPVEVL